MKTNFALKRVGFKPALGAAVLALIVVCATQPALATTEKLLYSFGAQYQDGAFPNASLVMDTQGNLYSTTYGGGAHAMGTVFKLTPSGTETVLYSFGGQANDGQNPLGSLIIDSKNNLYGTTYNGGANGDGTVFKLTPAGVETVVHSFKGSPDGSHPRTGLIVDKGNAYGTTTAGGSHGYGAVFKVTPAGTETVLYSFGGIPDGNTPFGALTMDTTGTLYGTTFYGGTDNFGTVFKLTLTGTETVLHSFVWAPGDGEYPLAGLVTDKSNNLYGTTSQGGAYSDGTVFELTTAGAETVLYNFGSNSGDGANAYPEASLIRDTKGNLYGTTVNGGANNEGMVFEISPPTSGSTWTETILHSFSGEPGDGETPFAGLIVDKAGKLCGTTWYGGAYNSGAVFEVGP